MMITAINNIKNFSKQNYQTTFCAKRENNNLNSPEPIEIKAGQMLQVDFMPDLPKVMPDKFELTDAEIKYNEIWNKYKLLDMNIYTQKSNLRDFYSAQDRLDYRELLRKRKSLADQLKTFIAKHGLNQIFLEANISTKKEYNRYAPKILRAQSIEELNEVRKTISSMGLKKGTLMLLEILINQHSKEITKAL